MQTVFNVAAYILEKIGSVSHIKLQKLVYYSQAWSLVWDDEPIYTEPIQAWANGPVVPPLFFRLQGKFKVSLPDLGEGTSAILTSNQKETIDRVLSFYAPKDSQWLSDLTHVERPWVEARIGLAPGERGNRVISLASMAEYYASL